MFLKQNSGYDHFKDMITKRIKKITSVRQYNKIRHKIFLCRDDFGKKLYAGDFAELTASMETQTPWISRIWWNSVDGAFVDSHPAHIKMKIGGTRELRYFLRDKFNIPINDWETDTIKEYKPSHSIKKVTYSDYLNWKKEQKEKDKKWKEKQETQE